jgi:transcriptional regulator with XRE-family HTH domain
MSGKELRELLASNGILQKDIAKALNITPGAFSQFLRAKDIKTSLLESICEVLNVKMDFFYKGTKYMDSYIAFQLEDYKKLSAQMDKIQKAFEKIDSKL